MDLVAPFLLLAMGCGSGEPSLEQHPTSRGAYVLRPMGSPEARLVAIPLRWTPDVKRVYIGHTNEAGIYGIPGTPLPEVASFDQRTLTLLSPTGEEHEYEIAVFHEPVPAPNSYLQDLEVAREAASQLDPAMRPCSYEGDSVQPVLNAGVTVEQLTNAVVLKWTAPARGVKAEPAAVLRTSLKHMPAIQLQLEKLARDPSVGLDNRLMAAGTLLEVTEPESREEKGRMDFGHEVVNGFASQYSAYAMRCDRTYFASKRTVMDAKQ